MNCAFCGRTFDETAAPAPCKKCALFGGCRMVKCPYCGYETPQDPAWARAWRSRRRRKQEKK